MVLGDDGRGKLLLGKLDLTSRFVSFTYYLTFTFTLTLTRKRIMSELVNVVVALAVIVFIVRWATSGEFYYLIFGELRYSLMVVRLLGHSLDCLVCSVLHCFFVVAKDSPEQQSAIAALGFRPKNVTDDMVRTH